MNLGFLQVSSLHFGVLSIIMIFFNRYNLRLLALKKKKKKSWTLYSLLWFFPNSKSDVTCDTQKNPIF